MIVLFTDFALPYTGQMRLAIAQEDPTLAVVDLFTDAPSFNPQASAYLLAAYAQDVPVGAVVLCVVDPGVGSPRDPVAVKADGRWFVGPDNGLLSQVVRQAETVEAYRIDWRPERPLSASFHGRDLFAPMAVRLVHGLLNGLSQRDPASLDRPDWPDDWAAVVYIDTFGNAITGLRADSGVRIAHDGNELDQVETFSLVNPGCVLMYKNANGLLEISVNQGSAAENLDLSVGCQVIVMKQ